MQYPFIDRSVCLYVCMCVTIQVHVALLFCRAPIKLQRGLSQWMTSGGH